MKMKRILVAVLAVALGVVLSACGSNSSQTKKKANSKKSSKTTSERSTKEVEITNDEIYSGNILINKFFNIFNMVNSDVSISKDNIENGTNAETNCNVNIDGTYANISDNSGSFDVLIYCDKCESEGAMKKIFYAYTRAYYPLVKDDELDEIYQTVMKVDDTTQKGLAEIDNVGFTYTPKDVVHNNARTLEISMTSINLQENEIEIYAK